MNGVVRRADATASPETGSVRKKRLISRKTLIALVSAGALVIVGGTWFGFDMSQRREVPDLKGLTLTEAEETLSKADLILDAELTDAISYLKDENTIISAQTPSAGSTLGAGDSVNVTVLGREKKMPNLVGMSIEEANDQVASEEFVLHHRFGDHTLPSSWLISDQSVAAGENTAAGSGIDIELDVPDIVMPAVTGQDRLEVGRTLAGIGVEAMFTGEGSHVATSSVPSGTTLEPFAPVELTLGYRVPNLIGMSVSDAKSAMSDFPNAKFVGELSRPVVAQSVPVGAVIAAETDITVTSPPQETVYRILGSGSTASISWAVPGSFSIQQATNASLPWEMRFPTSSGIAVFNAQLQSGDSITCQLERNGKIVKELTSSGPYAVVQC